MSRARAYQLSDVGASPVNPKAPFVIVYDTREQTVPPFPDGVLLERKTMSTGDYTCPDLEGLAVIERKSTSDFASSITWGRERLDDEMRRMRDYQRKCFVVEGNITDVMRMTGAHPHTVIGSVASFTARYDCPVIFAGNSAGAGRMIAGILRRWREVLLGVIE